MVTMVQRGQLTCSSSLTGKRQLGLELQSESLIAALLDCVGFSNRTGLRPREGEEVTWGPTGVGNRTDHTGEVFSFLVAPDGSG